MSQDSLSLQQAEGLPLLFDEYWSFVLESWPVLATLIGDHRYDDKIEDLSQESFDAWTDKAKRLQERLRKITFKSLPFRDQINYDLFEREMQQRIDSAEFRPNLININQIEGPQIILPLLTSISPFLTLSDYQNYLKRLQSFPRQVAQTISNLQEGIRRKVVLAEITTERVIAQVRSQIVSIPESSALYSPAKHFPESLSLSQKEDLSKQMKHTILQSVVSSYQSLFDFLQEKYRPACYHEIGLWNLPNGNDWYRFYVQSYATTKLSPEEIYELGKRELHHAQREMTSIIVRLGFKGDLRAFFKYLRDNPEFYNDSAESLLTKYRDILSGIESIVSHFFGKLPKARVEVKEIEAFRAEQAPAAHYFPPADDGSRPGYFYVNTHNPKARPTFDMEALAYHEAIPGHHFQMSLQHELKDLPEFRRHGGYVWPGYSAFVEGWGLYSEFLAKEMGMYRDPYSDFGRLMNDAFRCARLVVDTGIHWFRWTREQGMSFLEANTALPARDIIAEVERYAALPGQALAYKVGQLKILQLRDKAQKTLGELFDLRSFHDQLLDEGGLPLDLMETKVERWISRRLNERM